MSASIPGAGLAFSLAVPRKLLSLGISPMEGRRPRLPCGRAVVGVVKVLRLDGRRNAVDMSSPRGEMADSAIGVTPAAMGVWPPSFEEKNLDLEPWSPNEVISLSADVFAMLRCGPRLKAGGESGGLKISGILGLGFMTVLIFWKVTCCAEGDVHGSVVSCSVQAKL